MTPLLGFGHIISHDTTKKPVIAEKRRVVHIIGLVTDYSGHVITHANVIYRPCIETPMLRGQ